MGRELGMTGFSLPQKLDGFVQGECDSFFRKVRRKSLLSRIGANYSRDFTNIINVIHCTLATLVTKKARRDIAAHIVYIYR